LEKSPRNRFHLFISLYSEPNPNRLKEYELCLKYNLDNQWIERIHILFEDCQDQAENVIRKNFQPWLNHPNIDIRIAKRQKVRSISYLDFISFANEILPPNTRFIIANSDIYFDESLELIQNFDFHKRVFALTRYNVKPYLDFDGKVWQRSIGSQDSWFFQTPFPEEETFDLYVGWMGCDSRIAYELDKAGLEVLNPSLSIKCWHLHEMTMEHHIAKKYSYKFAGKAYKFLPFYTLDEIQQEDFSYPQLPESERQMIEEVLAIYAKQQEQGSYEADIHFEQAKSAEKGKGLYAFVGNSLRKFYYFHEKRNWKTVPRMMKKLGLILSQIGFDLRHIDERK